MPILEQIPEKKVFTDTYRKISDTKVTSADPMVKQLCQMADQLRDNILDLETLRTRDLAKVLAKVDTELAALSPKLILELQQALDKAENEEEKADLRRALDKQELAGKKAREQLNAAYFQTAKQIRDKCYNVSQSGMADYIIETLADRRKTLDRLTKLSEETLVPLMKKLEEQIADIDANLAEKLDENIFEKALRLLPNESDLVALVKKATMAPVKSAGTQPNPPAAADLPDEGKAAGTVAKKTDTPKPLSIDTVVSSGEQAAKSSAALSSNAALSLASLTSVIPEEEALKLAYQALQNVLSCISDNIKVTQQISKRLKLRESLDDLRQKYEDIQQQYRTISFDIENLDRLNQFLDQTGAYFTEAEKLDITLTAYAEALNTASADPAAYYGIVLMLRQYMQKLELIWR